MLGPIVLGLLFAVVLLVTAVVLAGRVALGRLRRRITAPGRLVTVDGIRYHIDVRGEARAGVPTVVLEAGIGAAGATWAPLLEELSAAGRVVAYDRAGLGWSDPVTGPRTPVAIANQLRAVLAAAEITGPYVLVGHSFGGLVARVFAATHPDDVAGIVLLDGAHEDQFERFPEAIRDVNARMTRITPLVLGLFGILGRIGLLALRPALVPTAGWVGDESVAVRERIAAAPHVFATMARELRDLAAGNAEVRALDARPLRDIPITVVSHGHLDGMPPGLGPDIAAEYEAVWQELQVAQASLSRRSRRLIAPGVGHNIHLEAPSLVADEVLAMLAPRPTALTA